MKKKKTEGAKELRKRKVLIKSIGRRANLELISSISSSANYKVGLASVGVFPLLLTDRMTVSMSAVARGGCQNAVIEELETRAQDANMIDIGKVSPYIGIFRICDQVS